MKRIKGFIELIKNIFLFLTLGLWWLWALLLTFYISYLISVSDLPDWFKFFLLR